jgi:hypothetical protein
MLIRDVYPELSSYLQEYEMEKLAENLGCGENQLWHRFCWKKKIKGEEKDGVQVKEDRYVIEKNPAVVGGMRNVVRGRTVRDGKEYSKKFVEKVAYTFELFQLFVRLFV